MNELDNLLRIGMLKREPPSARELPHTMGLPAKVWRVLAKAHERRNLAEYEGNLEQDERLLTGLIAAAQELREAVTALPQIPKPLEL